MPTVAELSVKRFLLQNAGKETKKMSRMEMKRSREGGRGVAWCEYCQKANGVMWKPVDDCRTKTAAVSCHTWLTVPTHPGHTHIHTLTHSHCWLGPKVTHHEATGKL